MAHSAGGPGAHVHAVTRPHLRHLRPGPARLLVAVALGAFALFVWGGYGLGWRWTGLSGRVTLWDWLRVLALPVALGIAPLLLQYRQGLTRRHHGVLGAALIAFAGLVSAGYVVPLAWTGFTGNTLWDWLNLTLLPLVVAIASLWVGGVSLRRPHLVASAAVVAAFALFVAGGYLVPWTWTGFRGNTAWDWIQLLLVPLLVPTILMPAVQQRVRRRLAPPAAGSDGQSGRSVPARSE